MSEERKRILQMLGEGKITADEAEGLLTALQEEKVKPSLRKEAKFLRVKVWEDGKDKVNVNIPLSLAKLAMKFIPSDAKATLDQQEIDLAAILKEIQDSPSAGKIVEVEDGDSRVEVFLE